jgi:Arc/MetJ-type ribon-helix-helix transcriptional regulator
MVRTQIQLPEQQVALLKRLADQQHVSMAELIRRAVDLLTQSPDAISIKERKERALAATGRFHSGRGDLADRHDDYLAEAFK